MEEQFIRLQQLNRSVDEYAAEFLRLSQFAPYMVSDEEKRASRFQHGLKMDIQSLELHCCFVCSFYSCCFLLLLVLV